MEQRKILTPLWIISLFVSLTQTMVSVAVIQTTGVIQILLATFVVIFPILIASAFFIILWYRPYVLYAPSEYENTTDANYFVQAMLQRPYKSYDKILIDDIKNVVKQTINSQEIINQLTQVIENNKTIPSEEVASKILNSLNITTREQIEESFIYIDLSSISPYKHEITVPYDPNLGLENFLNEIYYALAGEVKAFTFGVDWILIDESGLRLRNLESLWSRKSYLPLQVRSTTVEDRKIKDVSIYPGMKIKAIRNPHPEIKQDE